MLFCRFVFNELLPFCINRKSASLLCQFFLTMGACASKPWEVDLTLFRLRYPGTIQDGGHIVPPSVSPLFVV